MFLLPTRYRPMMRVETLVLIVVAILVATANGAWWTAVLAERAWTDPGSWAFAALCYLALVALHFALLAPFARRAWVKPMLSLIVVGSAAAAYFMDRYSVLLDPAMVRNALHTDAREASDLLTPGMLAWVAAWSALPLAFIWTVRLARVPWRRALWTRMAAVAAALVISAIAVLPVSRDLFALMRNRHEARYLITPGNVLYGLAIQSVWGVADARAVREPVGTDARMTRLVADRDVPRVLVLVVGETARAANFSLLGYHRETNPQLATLDVTVFGDVTSCGTSTEVSVPCMFSALGRDDYDEKRIRNSEGLLDVLVRAGYAVRWIDNQSGCKGVCRGAGVDYRKIDAASAPGLCDAGECLDEALVVNLRRELDTVRRDTVIVLHMMGNHGPAYFRRYPPEFRRFLPDCRTAELRDCTRAQVVNAYDNAILYTDHVLAGIVRTLRAAAPGIDGAMWYVSDHGESLGEKGLYLHGIPSAIAPAEQTHVPMIVWLSPRLAQAAGVGMPCVRRNAGRPLSHDYLFHSVISLLDVRTSVYRPERDVFDGCRGDVHRAMNFGASTARAAP